MFYLVQLFSWQDDLKRTLTIGKLFIRKKGLSSMKEKHEIVYEMMGSTQMFEIACVCGVVMPTIRFIQVPSLFLLKNSIYNLKLYKLYRIINIL